MASHRNPEGSAGPGSRTEKWPEITVPVLAGWDRPIQKILRRIENVVDSRPGILPGVPCLEYFTGLILPDPATSTPGYYITATDGNPFLNFTVVWYVRPRS